MRDGIVREPRILEQRTSETLGLRCHHRTVHHEERLLRDHRAGPPIEGHARVGVVEGGEQLVHVVSNHRHVDRPSRGSVSLVAPRLIVGHVSEVPRPENAPTDGSIQRATNFENRIPDQFGLETTRGSSPSKVVPGSAATAWGSGRPESR